MGISEKTQKPERELEEEAPGLELTTALPEDVKTNDLGVPTYFGLVGTPLITVGT